MPTISKHTVGREQTLYIRRYLRVRGYAHLRSTSDRLCLPHTLHRSSPTSQFKSGLHPRNGPNHLRNHTQRYD